MTEYVVSKAISPPPGCISTTIETFEANIQLIPTEPTWPTPNGLTEMIALQQCKTVLEAQVAFEACRNIRELNYVAVLDSCVVDLQVW